MDRVDAVEDVGLSRCIEHEQIAMRELDDAFIARPHAQEKVCGSTKRGEHDEAEVAVVEVAVKDLLSLLCRPLVA